MSHADRYQRQYDDLSTSHQTLTRQLKEAAAAGEEGEVKWFTDELKTVKRWMNSAEASLILARKTGH